MTCGAIADVVGTPGEFTGLPANAYSEIPGIPGFFFWDIRNDATVGLSDTYDNSSAESDAAFGDLAFGSIEICMTGGSDKAGIAYVLDTPELLSSYTGGTYDWFRDAVSDNPDAQSPALFFTIDADGSEATTDDRFGLKYEAIYNGVGPVMPEDTWVTATIGSSTNLWSWNAPDTADRFVFNITLDDWKTEFPEATILVVGLDAGSGWNGVFKGAVDLLVLEFTGETMSFDFELLPEFQADLTLGTAEDSAKHKFDGVYSDDSSRQVLRTTPSSKGVVTTYFAIQNDGNRDDTLSAKCGGLNPRRWKGAFYDLTGPGRRNVTGLLVSGNYSKFVTSGSEQIFMARVGPKKKSRKILGRRGGILEDELRISARSSGSPAGLDRGGIVHKFRK